MKNCRKQVKRKEFRVEKVNGINYMSHGKVTIIF